jgi:hypothetical protein
MISKNGIAVIILVVEGLLSALGVEFEPDTVGRAVEGIVVAVSLILLVVNQLGRDNVSMFIFKK